LYEYDILINSICNEVDEFFRRYLGSEYALPRELYINFCKKTENSFLRGKTTESGKMMEKKKINLYIDENLEPNAELMHTIMHEYIHILGRYPFDASLDDGVVDFLSFLITNTIESMAYERAAGVIAILWNSAWSGASTDEDAKKILEAYVERDAAKWEKVIEQAADNYKLTGNDKKIFMDIYMNPLPLIDLSDKEEVIGGRLLLSQIKLYDFLKIENIEEILVNNGPTIQYIANEFEELGNGAQIAIKMMGKLISSFGEMTNQNKRLMKDNKRLVVTSGSSFVNCFIVGVLSLLIRYFLKWKNKAT
ncbi:hypothetical protein HZA39_04255, partial [Candidatus Peregrinibacteria bacterium]|nr:hypothetical protein [Candidatus Peregrinibacteria bacterium]